MGIRRYVEFVYGQIRCDHIGIPPGSHTQNRLRRAGTVLIINGDSAQTPRRIILEEYCGYLYTEKQETCICDKL